MKAKDVMTKTVVSVRQTTNVREIAQILLKHRISAVPVVNERNGVIGMVSEGDLISRPESGTEHQNSGSWWLNLIEGNEERSRKYLKSHGLVARDVMTRKIITVDENASLEKVATLLEHHHIKRVPVMRRGKIVGIASRANLLHGLASRGSKTAKTSKPSNTKIRESVIAEFRRAGLQTNYVNVVVSGSTVHLWGLVESPSQRKALSLAAKGVAGVKTVENHLSIQLLRTMGWE